MLEYRRLENALTPFCDPNVNIQAQAHVKPLHYYSAIRLVLEGGFLPEDIKPTPPFKSEKIRRDSFSLEFDEGSSSTSEATILGGLRTKQIDLTVSPPGVEPALGISFKTTSKAFRNIPNRIEELIGDATNIHIRYPAFTYGFLHVIRMIRESDATRPNDVSFTDSGDPVDSIVSFHSVLSNLGGRNRLSDSPRLYEAVALVAVECTPDGPRIHPDYPTVDSPLHLSKFFNRLYEIYDERFVYVSARREHCRKIWTLSNDDETQALGFGGIQDQGSQFSYSTRE